MWVFFSFWGAGTLIALLFLEGGWQFLMFVGSAWLGVWVTAAREDDGTRWGEESARRSGEKRDG
ncbi:MAG TPA: hypothetical protein VLD62_12995 [Acidimicrobiia bacterium]|nr:hypothetical protein [Acidimicrobiia bacterium]